MPSYYAGFKAGSKHVYILEKYTDKVLAVSYSVPNAKMIVKALNTVNKGVKKKK